MKRGDASFTFLSRIQEIEWNVQDARWQSALALALTLPDICGGIEYPELVRRYRDGRVMEDRNGLPARDVGSQYIRWFNTYAASYFKRSQADVQPYLSGERCWQLRCEYLHQNKGFVNEENGEEIRFQLGINCGSSICMTERQEENGQIRLDIQQICFRMCQAARAYYEANQGQKEFSLYQTPVLDFTQWASRGEDLGKTIAVICSDKDYGEGIQAALKQVSALVELFRTPEAAKLFLQKKQPAMWVITEEISLQKNQPWRADQMPVLILTSERTVIAEDGRYIYFPMPCDVDSLRACIKERLK